MTLITIESHSATCRTRSYDANHIDWMHIMQSMSSDAKYIIRVLVK